MNLKPYLLAATFFCLLPLTQARAERTIHFDPIGHGFLVVHATVNGKDGRFLFDTGSGLSNVTPAFAEAIGCKPWGQVTGFRMTGKALTMQRCNHADMQVGAVHLSTDALGVFDVGKVVPPELGHIDGTIALDLFEGKSITLSYAGHLLSVLSKAELEKRTRRLKPLPLLPSREAGGLAYGVNIPVVLDVGTAWFELDSGNTSGAVIVGNHLAKEFNIEASNKKPEGGHFQLANGLTFDGVTAARPIVVDGNFGATFLTYYDVTLDLQNDKAWLEPHKDAVGK